MASTIRYLRLAALALLLSACATQEPQDTRPAPVEKTPEHAIVKPRPQAPPPSSAAYQPLLDKAAGARQRGDFDQALALLERAQRIDPDSAEIYLAMALTHSERGDAGQARAVAERGLLYCRNTRECDALRVYAR